MKPKFFKYKGGRLKLPLFFPDATRGFVKTLDSVDIENSKTQGVLVNTYHLYKDVGLTRIKKFGGIRKFMNFKGAIISDSGGFQINSLGPKVTDLLTPEKSIEFQIALGTDLVVVLDEFTPPEASYKKAEMTVDNTIDWARRSKKEFERLTHGKKDKPYIIGVVQGGEFMDLREKCTKQLVKIGFDGLGWGGWPFVGGKINFESAEIISRNTPENYFLYGLGFGKPEDIIKLFKLGYTIFDCVLPTRDGRHGRLCVWNKKFYEYFDAKKAKNADSKKPVSENCDCLLCKNYSRGYLYHLFKMKDPIAMRLASTHNLRFYSQLMEKLQNKKEL